MLKKSLKYRPNLNQMKPYVPGRSIESVAQDLGITDIIKLASNENALGCPLTEEELKSAYDKIYYYANKERRSYPVYIDYTLTGETAKPLKNEDMTVQNGRIIINSTRGLFD